MLPIVILAPGVTGEHWLSALQVIDARGGTMKVPDLPEAHAITSGLLLSPVWQVLT
jgi:hypothetical protein